MKSRHNNLALAVAVTSLAAMTTHAALLAHYDFKDGNLLNDESGSATAYNLTQTGSGITVNSDGSAAFMESARELVGRVTNEQPGRHDPAHWISFSRIVEVVEEVKGEAWADFCGRYGDWGGPLVLYLA